MEHPLDSACVGSLDDVYAEPPCVALAPLGWLGPRNMAHADILRDPCHHSKHTLPPQSACAKLAILPYVASRLSTHTFFFRILSILYSLIPFYWQCCLDASHTPVAIAFASLLFLARLPSPPGNAGTSWQQASSTSTCDLANVSESNAMLFGCLVAVLGITSCHHDF